MKLGQVIATAAISAVLSGGVGFGSSYILQKRAQDQRLIELREQHDLEMQRASEAASKAKAEQRSARTLMHRERWTSEPLITQRRRAIQLLKRHPSVGYAQIESLEPLETSRQLDPVISFWMNVEYDSDADLLDSNLTARLLGPDARGWKIDLERLTKEIDLENPPPEHGRLIYALWAVNRVAAAVDPSRRNHAVVSAPD